MTKDKELIEETNRKYDLLEYKLEQLEEKLNKHTRRWSCHEYS